jgi:hypothetical protein
MPFSKLSDEQILAVLAEQPRLLRIPGVRTVWVDYVDRYRTVPGLVVTVDATRREAVRGLPAAIAGLPVVVNVEDLQTMTLVETIRSGESR